MQFFSASNKAFIDSPYWEDCVEVSDALFTEVMDKVSQGWTLEADANGQPVAISPTPPEPPTKAQVFRMRVNFLNSQYELAVAALRDTYPQAETSTWPVQIAEAKLYQAWIDGGSQGVAPETPFLTDLTAARDARGVGAGLADLVTRIINNDSIYSLAMAFLTAVRHKAEQDMYIANEAGEIEDILEVIWDFSLSLPEEPTATAPEEA